MKIERIVWIVAVLAVAGIAYFTGQTLGARAAAQGRAQAAQQFFEQRGGTTGGQGQTGRAGGGVFGTVSAVSADSLTVTTRAGQSVTVKLASGGVVHKQVDGQLSDVKQGDTVVVTGQQNGDTIEATAVQIGGFGGQGGNGSQRAPGGNGTQGAPGGNNGGQPPAPQS